MAAVASPQFNVFLSYHGRDQEHAQKIARFLEGRGLKVFAQRWYSDLLVPWPQALEQHLERSGAIMVCIGAGELSSWQQREVGLAVEQQAQRAYFPIIPVLLPGADPVSAFLSADPWLDLRVSSKEEAELTRIEPILRGAGPTAADGSENQPSREEICPYRGLLPFREQDAALFFGRDAAVTQLQALLQRNTLVGVVGLWGSGKSSLVRAGLVPRLRRDLNVGWEVATLVPGEQPWHALAAALGPLLETRKAWTEAERLAEAQRLGAQFAEGSVSLKDIVVRILNQQSGGDRLLLVADQWEELYTACRNPLAWRGFVGELLDASAHAPLRVVLTMRLDFVAEALRFRPLEQRLRGVLMQLAPMARADLEQTIVQPAQKTGLTCEPALLERLLDDVGDSAENLPLLQFALRRLWEQRREKGLWLQDYADMGGLQGAMAHVAERIRASLSEGEQTALRNLMLDVVQPNPNRTAGRRRYRLSDLPEAARQRVPQLEAERLLAVSKSEETGQSTVEVAHEALLLNWAELQAWLAQDMDFLLWREDLRVRVAEWEQKRRPADLRLWGESLAQAESWSRQHGERLSAAERDFIAVSAKADQERPRQSATQGQAMLPPAGPLDANQQRPREEGAQQTAIQNPNVPEPAARIEPALPQATVVKKPGRAARRKRLVRKLAAALLGAALVISVVLGWRVRDDWRKTAVHQLAAVARAQARDHLDTALLLAVEAFRQLPDAETQGALLSVVAGPACDLQYHWGHKAAVLTVASSPDGQTLATGAKDGTIGLWKVGASGLGAPTWLTHTSAVNGVAFSPDGRSLASASDDGTVILWNVADQKPVGPASTGHAGPALGVAFSPDGRRLATGGGDGHVILWDVTQRSSVGGPLVGHQAEVWKVAFSPDGRILAAVGGDGAILLWNAETGAAAGKLATGSPAPVLSLAFSPDGQTLAAGYAAGAADPLIRLWSLATQQSVAPPLTNHLGAVRCLSFAPDGKTLASAGLDGTVRLWDVAKHAPLGSALTGHVGSVWAVTFVGRTGKLASVGDDTALIVWNPATRTPLGVVLPGTQGALQAVVFSRDGTTIAAAGEDHQIHLWDAARPETALASLTGATSAVQCLALNPSGQLLAAGGREGTIRLWDMATRAESTPPLLGHTGCVWSVAFSPEGQMLASGGSDYSVRLWEVAKPAPLGAPLLGHKDFVEAVAFSPRDHTLVSASWDKTVMLWNADTRAALAAPLLRSDSVPACVAFSPDGRWLALGNLDNTVLLWSMSERKQVGRVMAGHTAPVVSVAFSPDGRILASGSMDHTIILWDAPRFARVATLANVHHEQVRGLAFAPDGRALVSVGEDGAAVLVKLDPETWVRTALRMANREFLPAERQAYLGR